MNIGIDLRSTLKKPTGIGQYTLGLVKGLIRIDKRNQYYLYCKKNIFSRYKKIPRIKAHNFMLCNDGFNRGIMKTVSNIDIFFSPSADFLDTEDIPIVVNIHDLRFKAYPRFYDKSHIDYRDTQIKRVLRTAQRITCVSNNTKKDLVKFYGDYEIMSKTEVVYPGVDKEVFNTERNPNPIKKNINRYNITIPYILSVGTISRIKNSASILKAFYNFKKKTSLPHILVLIGSMASEYSLEELLSDAGLDKEILRSVVFTGYESDENLAHLYKQAALFILPSFYEGFGIPIIEAFACGVPVITSNTSACSEVAGEAALTIDPNSVDELSDAIIKVVTDDTLREQLSKNGITRSKDFSWEKTASGILNILGKEA